MYPKFIEVHSMDNAEFSVNVNEIVLFRNGRLLVTSDRNVGCVTIAETYDELKTMIKDCGCLIHKQDPRLDTTHPLRMEDLREMEGEPVWNSNDRHWYLVWLINELDTDRPVHLRYRDGVMLSMSADDLMKYPLYRMKV